MVSGFKLLDKAVSLYVIPSYILNVFKTVCIFISDTHSSILTTCDENFKMFPVAQSSPGLSNWKSR